ncbi:MAG: MAPEG family protein [Pseudomonadales bacterium]
MFQAEPILLPVFCLVLWTIVQLFWMAATRLPAIAKAKLGPTAGRRTADLANQLPEQVQWKADNYNHLHEAPTLFYAVAIVLAIIGQGDGFNTILAWAYVGLRIAHSIVQATINRVIIRFALYALSSLVLMALILHAGIAVF